MSRESVQLSIDRLWDGSPAPAHARVGLSISGLGDAPRSGLAVRFSAPFHGDAAPTAAPGRFDTLWEYEVVELFVANERGRYIEMEFGPHGHYLALGFDGERNCVDRHIDIAPQIVRDGDRWVADCIVPPSCLPEGCDRLNAYAVYGTGSARTHLAYSRGQGPRPDFHALSTFVEFRRLTGDA